MLQILNLKAKTSVFVVLLCAFLFTSSQAVADTTALYIVEILVVDESTSVRNAAFKQGLDEVFVRVSGDSLIMDKIKRPTASVYVKQYSYEPLATPLANLQDEFLTHRLMIHYNGSLIEKHLQQNGFPVWGAHRPDVVIWLAVRDGVNEYVLRQDDVSALKTAVDEALVRRGIPVQWPRYDSKDKKNLSIADIRGGFSDPLTLASKRYSRGPILAGSLIWNGELWQSNWNLLMHNGERHWKNHHWSEQDKDYKLLINKAVDQAADALARVFAVRAIAGDQQKQTVRLSIQAVNSINRYHRIERYLTALNAVESIIPFRVDGRSVTFDVALHSNKNDFFNLINNDAMLLRLKPSEVAALPLPTVKSEPLPETPDSDTSQPNINQQSGQPEPVVVYHYRLQQ